MKKKKKLHGGAGRGQGRKKGITFTEPTKLIRVPLSLVDHVEELKKNHKILNQKSHE